MNAQKSITELRNITKERKFTQSVELVIAISGIDLKKPENRIAQELRLPKPFSTPKKVIVIGNGLQNAKNAHKTYSSNIIDDLAADQKKVKKLANDTDFIIAETTVMADIGKKWGKVLGPRGKMPKALPPNADPTKTIEGLQNTVALKLGEKPLIQCRIGDEKMSDDDLKENIASVISTISEKLPRGKDNIRKLYVKMTMSPALRVEDL